MSLSRAKCSYVGSYIDACDAIPPALQRIVSYEYESRLQDRDTRDFILQTVKSFRGGSRRGNEGDAISEKDMKALSDALVVYRKQIRDKVSLAEQTLDVLDYWKKNLNDAHASEIETALLMELSETNPVKAAELLEKGRKEIPVNLPPVETSVVFTTIDEKDKAITARPLSSSKDSALTASKPKPKPAAITTTKAMSSTTQTSKLKVAKRPAPEKLTGPPPKKAKPPVSTQTSVEVKTATKKVEAAPDKKKKKTTKKTETTKKEEGWMRFYKQTVWRGVGKLPPLCGPEPAVSTYIIPVGDFVAAKNPTKPGEAPSWMVATVVKYSSSRRAYEVEDVDAEEAKVNKKGTKTSVPRDSVIPLPLQMPDFTSSKEFPVGRKVIALYPKTTCFYEGKVVQTPSMIKANYYLVEFMDDDDEDDEGGKKVAHALVLDYPNANQKALSL